MAIVIDENLTASPARTRLPSGPITLRQTLHCDLGGDTVRITYTLDGRHNVCFQTAQGQVKQIQITGRKIPGSATELSDTVALVAVGSGTALAQVEIKKSIQGGSTCHDSVILAVLS
jgi:hypothetical protein